jgi:rhodanese-related sulfurtransferase
VEQLAARLKEAQGIAVIDVRGPDEFMGPLGQIREARNLPLTELPRHLQALESLTEKPIVLVCRTDKRSASAAALLGEAGFRMSFPPPLRPIASTQKRSFGRLGWTAYSPSR